MNFLSFLLVSGLLTSTFLVLPAQALDKTTKEREQHNRIASEQNTISIFKQASPLVVSVDSTQKRHNFLSTDIQEIPAGSGTGFIWDSKGHIITNFHVVQHATQNSSKITVTTKEGKTLNASIVGVEPRKDIAVLKVKNLKQKTTGFSRQVADTNQLEVGQKVLAIGNPFGFKQTLTQGIISALDRNMPSILRQFSIRQMIQTDASINPGNSGGPLIDSRGYLVGMNTALVSGSGTSSGVGFAVPANTIKRLVSQIIKHGQVIQPGIGITGLSPEKLSMLKIYGHNIKQGVVIDQVLPGSPADRAGLRGLKLHPTRGVILGDVITKVDNKNIESFDDLYNQLSEKKIGDQIKLKVRRKNKIFEKKLVLTAVNIQS